MGGCLVVTGRSRTEKLHDVGHHLGGVPVLTLLVLPLAGFQLPFDVALRARFQILPCCFRQATPQDDIVPFRVGDALA